VDARQRGLWGVEMMGRRRRPDRTSAGLALCLWPRTRKSLLVWTRRLPARTRFGLTRGRFPTRRMSGVKGFFQKWRRCHPLPPSLNGEEQGEGDKRRSTHWHGSHPTHHASGFAIEFAGRQSAADLWSRSTSVCGGWRGKDGTRRRSCPRTIPKTTGVSPNHH
jgi:hypothetical protein